MMLEAELVVNTTVEVKATKGGTQSATGCSRAGAEVKVFAIELLEFKTNGGGTERFPWRSESNLPPEGRSAVL
jgi:hypothetical protein